MLGNSDRTIPVFGMVLCLGFEAHVPEVMAKQSEDVKVTGTADFGFLAVPGHRVQFGKAGTMFDYVDEGGQDVLSFLKR